uniref:Uncharacterized protein n=1 Tax=Oryza brachyantha TaxID=4533 RepID=J3LCF6_ORYBR
MWVLALTVERTQSLTPAVWAASLLKEDVASSKLDGVPILFDGDDGALKLRSGKRTTSREVKLEVKMEDDVWSSAGGTRRTISCPSLKTCFHDFASHVTREYSFI